jgi:DNA glycosylase AlkZ-like
MRATIHLVSKRDYWPLAVAIRDPRRRWWERVHPNRPPDMRAAAKRLRGFLADGPRRRKEIEEFLGRERALGVGAYLDLVRVPPSGTWEQRRADLYACAEDWVGPAQVSSEEGLGLLVSRYLAAFGPAPKTDIADWGGIPLGELNDTLERMTLRRFRDEAGKELLDLPRAPFPDPDTPVPPRFLAVWDATLLVHARRTGILPEEYRALIFNTKTPSSFNTFLVDGRVAGTWRHQDGKVELEPFDSIPRAARRELDAEAKRLAAFHG